MRFCVTTACRLFDEEALGLLALIAGQGVDDAVDRLHGARGMQRAEHQVARFGGRHGHADRLAVA